MKLLISLPIVYEQKMFSNQLYQEAIYTTKKKY